MKTQLNFKQTAKIGGLLIIGMLLGWWIFGGASSEAAKMDNHITQVRTDEQANTVYTCLMHKQIRRDEPGKCPICGMDLIPVGNVENGGTQNPQALTMSPVAMKLADVATAPVVQKTAINKMRMPGKVAVNKRKDKMIPAYFPGRIEELYVSYTGAYVEKGEKLASVYSPKLITAQKELLQAYRNRKTTPALYRAARQKLRNWHISEQRIDQIIQSGQVQTNFIIRAQKTVMSWN